MKKQGIVIATDELTENMIERLQGTGINVLGLHPVGGKTAHESLDMFLSDFPTDAFQKNWKGSENRALPSNMNYMRFLGCCQAIYSRTILNGFGRTIPDKGFESRICVHPIRTR